MDSEKRAISIEDLTFAYDGTPVLEGVNVAIDERTFVSIVGPNGGGKTTLLRLVLGLLKPAKGRVSVFGQPPEHVRPRVGYMPQNAHLDPMFPVNVMDVVLMGRLGGGRSFGPYGRADKAAAEKALGQVGLHEMRRRFFSALSGGERQRALIARALACEPDLLLLDEPDANLDVAIGGKLYELLRELAKRLTVVVVSHDLGFVSQYVDTVICVARKVVVHPTSEITGETISEIYGGDVCMVRHDHTHEGTGYR